MTWPPKPSSGTNGGISHELSVDNLGWTLAAGGMTADSPPKLKRAYYAASVADFLLCSKEEVLGTLSANSEFDIGTTQRDAWAAQIDLLQGNLAELGGRGRIYFEFVVPRLGKRIDTIIFVDDLVFILEFKVGQSDFLQQDLNQVWDYALDLKNFHETSRRKTIVPMLVITGRSAKAKVNAPRVQSADGVFAPLQVPSDQLGATLGDFLPAVSVEPSDSIHWDQGRYRPTPTIVEAATALYRGHSVADIARNDADDKNLAVTTQAVSKIIEASQRMGRKSICLVTGVPGAGKTLVGLDIATRYLDAESELHSVYLSGNGPLVKILREALTRDEVQRAKARGHRTTKAVAGQAVKAFIQPIHHFRDECLKDLSPPTEHVTIFDEAQRAWDKEKTADFMHRKKGRPGFDMSEPEFLISCLDRHADWAVIVCLIGGGQEINTGEAGIGEWIVAIERSYPSWHVYVSPHLQDSEYKAEAALQVLQSRHEVTFDEDLHLSVSMRSFRAENVSRFVKLVLDLDRAEASRVYQSFEKLYPVVLTRDVGKAREWLKTQARGNERYGIVVSSQAQRLKPHAIDVRSPMDPVHWFLNDASDVRSSYYLEDVATEFHVQGLELDWTCVVWDADFRYSTSGWNHHSFVGDRWQNIKKLDRQSYLKNAYRVLLTRARQGMVIVVPEGSASDPTRQAAYYDATFDYLRGVGLPVL